MRILYVLAALLSIGTVASAQTVPNSGDPINTTASCSAATPQNCTQWTPTEWKLGWEYKVDVNNGTLNNPTIVGGTILGTAGSFASLSVNGAPVTSGASLLGSTNTWLAPQNFAAQAVTGTNFQISGGTITNTPVSGASGSFTTITFNGTPLGTASTANTGTSGVMVPLLSTANTWSAPQTFGTGSFTALTVNGSAPGTAGFATLGTSGATVPLLNGANTWSGLQNFQSLSTLQMLVPGSLSVVANTPLQGVYSTAGGANIAMCPGYNFGCPSVGHIMAQTASIMTSLGDAGTQESGIYAYVINQTGLALPWAASTSYSAGQVTIAASGTNLYKETAGSCTSATSGSGPTGLGGGITDGSCSWTYEGQPGLRGKIALASTTLVLPGGTDGWGAAIDTFIEPGWSDAFAAGAEVDITNNSGRDATGATLSIDDLYLGGSVGTNPISAYLSLSPFGLMGSNYMAHEGVFSQGQFTILGHDFRVSTHSLSAFFDDANSVHGTSSYLDSSTSPSGILLEGTYSSGSALVADNTIAAFQTSPGISFTGFSVTNAGTTINTTDANVILATGSANSYGRLDVFDRNSLNIQTGSAMTVGITLGALAGNINLNPTSGTIRTNGLSGVTCTAGTVSLTTLRISNGIATAGC